MRSYLAGASLWVVAVVNALLFGVLSTIVTVVDDHHFGWRLLVVNAPGAAIFGVAMGFVTRHQRRRTDPIVGGLSAGQRRAVARAVGTGTPPPDPALRPAAVAMARAALDECTRTKTMNITIFAAFAVLSGLLAFTSMWYLAATVMIGGCLIWTLRSPVALRRRIAALELADPRTENLRPASQ